MSVGCGEDDYLTTSVETLCKTVGKEHFCGVLREHLRTVQWWQTEATISFALFVAVTVLAGLTGSGGAAGAVGSDKPRATLLRATTFTAAALTLLTIAQNAFFPQGYGAFEGRAYRAKRLLDEVLANADGESPVDLQGKVLLLGNLNRGLQAIDNLPLVADPTSPGLSHTAIAPAVAYAAEAPPAPKWLADPPSGADRVCFCGIALSATSEKAGLYAELDARNTARAAFQAELYPPPNVIDDRPAEAEVDFLTQTFSQADRVLTYRSDIALYEAYSLVCTNRDAAKTGLGLLADVIKSPTTASMAVVSTIAVPGAYYVKRDAGLRDGFADTRRALGEVRYHEFLRLREETKQNAARACEGLIGLRAPTEASAPWVVSYDTAAACDGAREGAKAAAAFDDATRLDPRAQGFFDGVFADASTFFSERGDASKAIAIAKRGLDVQPDSPQLKATKLLVARAGAESTRVQEAQDILRKRGYLDGPATGKIDDPTYRALQRFQREKGLTVDGYPGGATLRALRDT
jgi:tetratricopeptide (TPR) repeat protein